MYPSLTQMYSFKGAPVVIEMEATQSSKHSQNADHYEYNDMVCVSRLSLECSVASSF